MRIVIYPDDRLREASAPVKNVDSEIREILREMHATMMVNDGIGIAAPQVGILQRMFVTDMLDGSGPIFFINPLIRILGSAVSTYNEGCLSIPGVRGMVSRPGQVLVKFLSIDGRPSELICAGLMSTVVQHEVNHLDGILHIDQMESHVRRMALHTAWQARK